jgi:hypothetical protein
LGSQSQIADLLYFLENLSALVPGVTLYMLTREHGPALALFVGCNPAPATCWSFSQYRLGVVGHMDYLVADVGV